MSLAPPIMSSRDSDKTVRIAPGTAPDSTMSKPCWPICQRISSRVSGTSAARKEDISTPDRIGGNQRRGATVGKQQEGENLFQFRGFLQVQGAKLQIYRQHPRLG